jgi:hypothetical protein
MPAYRSGMANNPSPRSLSSVPLWRLLVALDDAERAAGPSSSTARTLARAVQDRLREERPAAPPNAEREGGANATR